MRSAFGVDHATVSKAFRRRPKPPPRQPVPIKANLRRMGERATSADVSLKELGNTAGKATAAVSRGFHRFPGTTGTAIAGGAGYGAYKLAQKDKKRKKKG